MGQYGCGPWPVNNFALKTLDKNTDNAHSDSSDDSSGVLWNHLSGITRRQPW